MTEEQNVRAIQAVYKGAQVLQEGGKTLVFVPGITVVTAEGPTTFDGLLYPHAHPSGYTTRLFVSKQLRSPHAANWQSHTVCGGTWWVCSWNQVPASLPWLEILANHLRAFRCG